MSKADDDIGNFSFLKSLKYFRIYILLDILAFIIFLFLFIFQCTKPDANSPKCIDAINNGMQNVFILDTSLFRGYNNIDTTKGIYERTGQFVEWMDTGFVTDGEPFEVYVSGEWYPWGNDSNTTLECPLNTDFWYNKDNPPAPAQNLTNYESNIIKSSNQLDRYTTDNPRVRFIQNQYPEYYTKFSDLAFDCIGEIDENGNFKIGFNCDAGKKNPKPQMLSDKKCKLSNGRGVYMRIGNNDVKYAFHIINHFVPIVKKEFPKSLVNPNSKCYFDSEKRKIYVDSKTNLASCMYSYDLDSNNVPKQKQIPFALPTKIFNTDYNANNALSDMHNLDPYLINIINDKHNANYIYGNVLTRYSLIDYQKTCEDSLKVTDITFEQKAAQPLITYLDNCTMPPMLNSTCNCNNIPGVNCNASCDHSMRQPGDLVIMSFENNRQVTK